MFFQTLQDLNSVSELLDSCTMMDLGSELQTTKLLEHFSQARPHFKVSLVTLNFWHVECVLIMRTVERIITLDCGVYWDCWIFGASCWDLLIAQL